MTDPKVPEKNPGKDVKKNVLNVDVPTLMVILTLLILLPLLATGFISQ